VPADWSRAVHEIANIKAKYRPKQFDCFCLKCFRQSSTSTFCEHADCDSEHTIEWQDWRGMELCATGLMFKEERKWLLVRL
jgi:hypothetical protein